MGLAPFREVVAVVWTTATRVRPRPHENPALHRPAMVRDHRTLLACGHYTVSRARTLRDVEDRKRARCVYCAEGGPAVPETLARYDAARRGCAS